MISVKTYLPNRVFSTVVRQRHYTVKIWKIAKIDRYVENLNRSSLRVHRLGVDRFFDGRSGIHCAHPFWTPSAASIHTFTSRL
jgi:hypothetical protein